MAWIVEYWADGKDSVENWFNKLTHEEFKSVSKELKLLELCGNTLRLPHSKTLGKGLFELRERRYGFRIYYAFLKNRVIVLLDAGNKQTQQEDITTARFRLTHLLRVQEGII